MSTPEAPGHVLGFPLKKQSPATPAPVAMRVAKAKPTSRPKRWADACQRAVEALNELVEIQSEYEDWKDGLPENLQTGTLAEKLDEVCDLELSSAVEAVEAAADVDLPRGFGRD